MKNQTLKNYQKLKKFQTLLGDSEKTQPLRKLSDPEKESFCDSESTGKWKG